MARRLCTKCDRPVGACICAFIIKTNNKIPVLVLQHPSEVKQTKGTVALLKRSLTSCQVLVGEDFSESYDLNERLATHHTLLLYPGEQSKILSLSATKNESENINSLGGKPPLLIILDGTWKKAYRMFMLSKNLHSLAQVCLPDYLAHNGQYLIRKVAKKNALSSLEATCYALALLEGELISSQLEKHSKTPQNNNVHCGCYQPLLNKFSQFNHFQLSFRR